MGGGGPARNISEQKASLAFCRGSTCFGRLEREEGWWGGGGAGESGESSAQCLVHRGQRSAHSPEKEPNKQLIHFPCSAASHSIKFYFHSVCQSKNNNCQFSRSIAR